MDQLDGTLIVGERQKSWQSEKTEEKKSDPRIPKEEVKGTASTFPGSVILNNSRSKTESLKVDSLPDKGRIPASEPKEVQLATYGHAYPGQIKSPLPIIDNTKESIPQEEKEIVFVNTNLSSILSPKTSIQGLEEKALQSTPEIPANLKSPPSNYNQVLNKKIHASPPLQSAILEHLINLFLQNVALSALASDTDFYKSIKKKENQEVATKFKCNPCGRLRLQFSLECSHSVCYFCYTELIKSFLATQTLSSLKACQCPQCGLLPSAQLFTQLAQRVEKQFDPIFLKTCGWCKRKLNIFEDFPIELKCLHLCSFCYFNEVYFESTKCMCCDQQFNNISFTKMRKSQCVKCKTSGLTIMDGYKTIHLDHTFCYLCLTELVQNNSTCPICYQVLTGQEKMLLYSFLNVKCPICNEARPINEIRVCDICLKINCKICEDSACRCKLSN